MSREGIHSCWLGRWYFACSLRCRNPKRFLRLMETADGNGRALILQLMRSTFAIGRY
jgi:hypothetical protein